MKENPSGERLESINTNKNNLYLIFFQRFHEKSGNHTRALKLYIQGGEKYMDSAIQMIGTASNEHLTNTLLNYLMGITDGIPKDPIFTYKVYRYFNEK